MPPLRALEHPKNRGNCLLDALDVRDLGLLQPCFREVSLEQGAMLQQQQAPVERIYFPLSGMISLVSVLEHGEVIEAAIIGREGAIGALAGLGGRNAFTRAIVQIQGEALVISTSRFHIAISQSKRIRNLILRYEEALLGQLHQTAACNALHPLQARLARWLLQALDRTDNANLPLTQDVIAEMLAVRRTTITLAASALQSSGLISYRRGQIAVLNRFGLEEMACDCYRAIRRRTEAAFETPTLRTPEPSAAVLQPHL